MVKFQRCFAKPSAWTFTIKPISTLLVKYGAAGLTKQGIWIDPFAGKNSPADITNDLNAEMPTDFHLDALDFVKGLKDVYDGVLFDPPYSYRQITEHYAKAGIKANRFDTSSNFYNRVMDNIRIKEGGLAISFGWNSNGFGKKRGFKIIDGLLIAHGGHHNDTIATVERKVG